MIIRRVHIRRFRKLVDQVLECGPGLNVIRGRNDAGKSTVHLAFSAALFRIRGGDSLFSPWGEDRPGEITLEFEQDGRAYWLHKDFAARRVVLVADGVRLEDPPDVERRVGELLGLHSLSLFRAALHISHGDLGTLGKDQQREIGTHLSRIVTGGDSDAARVLKALDEEIRALKVGLDRPAGAPGPLRRDADLLQRLTEKQAKLSAEVEAIERAACERDRFAGRCAELSRQVEVDEGLLRANRDLIEATRQCQELERRAREFKDLLGRIDAAVRDLDVASQDEALRQAPLEAGQVKALQAAAARAALLRQQVAAAGEAAPGFFDAGTFGGGGGARRGPGSAASRWLPAGAIIAAVAALAGAALLAIRQAGWGIGLLLAALALAAVTAALGTAVRARRRAEVLEAEVRARGVEAARAALEARRRDVEEAERVVREGCAALGVASPEGAEDRLARAQQARSLQETARRVLENLLGARTREAIAEEYTRLLVELDAARLRLADPGLEAKRLAPAELQRLETESRRRVSELKALQSDLDQLAGRLKGRSPCEELAQVEEETAEVQGRLARTRRHLATLQVLHRVLYEAHQATIVDGKGRLEEHASAYVRALSDGRYDRITVDGRTLAPRVWVGPPKPGDWADVESREIGSGAVDQCYLALRLGLVAVLCEDRRPPLFLDDPFLAYDEDRQASAMRLIQELAGERQIFLFTCRSVYDAYVDRVLVLDTAPVPT